MRFKQKPEGFYVIEGDPEKLSAVLSLIFLLLVEVPINITQMIYYRASLSVITLYNNIKYKR